MAKDIQAMAKELGLKEANVAHGLKTNSKVTEDTISKAHAFLTKKRSK